MLASSPTKIFSTATELINFANQLIKVERLPSLKKDVKVCVDNACAFPAILYCFSVIDLLGTLYKGRISNNTKNSQEYMINFLRNNGVPYSGLQVELLQKVYRHKTVHVAQPKPLVKIGPDKITWRYDDDNQTSHLTIESAKAPQPVNILLTPYPMYFDKIFVISIIKLAQDIEESVTRPNGGYWDMLINDRIVDGKKLQDNFDEAIKAMYDPQQ